MSQPPSGCGTGRGRSERRDRARSSETGPARPPQLPVVRRAGGGVHCCRSRRSHRTSRRRKPTHRSSTARRSGTSNDQRLRPELPGVPAATSLLNTGAVAAAGPEVEASLRRLQDQALANTLADHQLPASDRDAVLSWVSCRCASGAVGSGRRGAEHACRRAHRRPAERGHLDVGHDLRADQRGRPASRRRVHHVGRPRPARVLEHRAHRARPPS